MSRALSKEIGMTVETALTAADYASLLAMAKEIGKEPNLEGLLLRILEKSMPWIKAEACSIFLPDTQTGELLIHSAKGESAPRLAELRIPAGKGIVGHAMLEKTIVRVDDAQNDPRFYKEADKATGWTTRALIAAPLMDGDQCLGAIEFLNPIGRPAFNPHDEVMIEYFGTLVASSLVRIQSAQIAISQAQVQRDLDLAREMQMGLLPKKFPKQEEFGDLDLYALIRPALEVSGDLYDFFPGKDGRLYFLVGDVSGKGVAAGLFMAVTRTLIRSVGRLGLDPTDLLTAVNSQLTPENAAMLFVTIVLGIYDPETGDITYAQGGHNRAVYLQAGREAQYEPSGGQPLGVFLPAEFAPLHCSLKSGDAFIIYSDGVTEAMNEHEELYGDDQLLSCLTNVERVNAKTIAKGILEDVDRHVNGFEQSDDITIMVLLQKQCQDQ